MSILTWIIATYICAGVAYWLAVVEAEHNEVEE